jgi:hypothetical protein
MQFANIVKATIAGAVQSSLGYSVYVYSGTKPASAETAPTGTLLVTLDASTQTITNGVINISNMVGTAVATGTAGYAVMTDGTSTSDNRIYFTIGTSGAELIMSSLNIVNGDIISGSGSVTVIA